MNVSGRGSPPALFPGECCFQVIYFNPNISFPPLIAMRLAPGVETTRSRHAVKNAWVRPAPLFLGIRRELRAPERAVGEVERLMSMKIAVALAATIGASVVMSSAAEARPEMVGLRGDYSPGTIVVKTNERRLYLVLDQGHAMRYPIGVGRAGKQWAGTTQIDGKYRNPAWSPPAEIRRDKPRIPDVIPGGSPRNPMGVAAMTLAGGEYAIHGTNSPGSVGGFVSYGCIRMLNSDISDLYSRVSVGTTVVVTR
jgi:lipoprotein-anchoring transpeptidase ErfK/SrfK